MIQSIYSNFILSCTVRNLDVPASRQHILNSLWTYSSVNSRLFAELSRCYRGLRRAMYRGLRRAMYIGQGRDYQMTDASPARKPQAKSGPRSVSNGGVKEYAKSVYLNLAGPIFTRCLCWHPHDLLECPSFCLSLVVRPCRSLSLSKGL